MRVRLISWSSARVAGERARAGAAGIENREADLLVDVAGEDDVAVDDGDHAVEDDGRSGGRATGREPRQMRGRRRGRQQAHTDTSSQHLCLRQWTRAEHSRQDFGRGTEVRPDWTRMRIRRFAPG